MFQCHQLQQCAAQCLVLRTKAEKDRSNRHRVCVKQCRRHHIRANGHQHHRHRHIIQAQPAAVLVEIDVRNDGRTDRRQHLDQEKQKHGDAVQQQDAANVAHQQVERVVSAVHERSPVYRAHNVRIPVHVLQESVQGTGEAAQATGYAVGHQVVPFAGDAIDERGEGGAHFARVDDQRSEGHGA